MSAFNQSESVRDGTLSRDTPPVHDADRKAMQCEMDCFTALLETA